MVTTVEALAALGDAAAACYGDAKLEVRGYLPDPGGLGGVPAFGWTPEWLDPWSSLIVAEARGSAAARIDGHLPPSYGDCAGGGYNRPCPTVAFIGTWVTIVAHYNDPAAASGSVPPVEPITVDQLVKGGAAIGWAYGLACLGSKEITFVAHVVPGVGLLSGMEQVTVEPRWLADSLNTGVVLSDTATTSEGPATWLVARVPPDMDPFAGDVACDGSAVDPKSCPFAPYVGKYVTVTGQYDDYESMTCHEVVGSDGALLDPAALVLECREQLVIDTVTAASGPGPGATPPTTSTEAHR